MKQGMTRSSYAQEAAWRSYQPHLPPDLRCTDDRVPDEEWWRWRDRVVHVDRHTTPEAPAKIIAFHGAAGHGRLLAPVGIAAREFAETVAPDMPGYGHTDLGARKAFTYDDWVDAGVDLVASESQRDSRPIILFGASIGGMLAYDVAARAPQVRGVIATCLLDPRVPAVRRAVLRHEVLDRLTFALPLAARLAPALRIPTRLLANVRTVANDKDLVAAMLADKRGAGNAVPLSFLASWLASQRPVQPERFDVCPILLVHPGDDHWTPAPLSVAFLARLAVDTKYEDLPGCGHFPVEEPGLTVMRAAMKTFVHDVLS